MMNTFADILATNKKGVTQQQAIELANKKRMRIPNNVELEGILVKYDPVRSNGKKSYYLQERLPRWFDDAFPAWSGTFAAYEAPDKKMDKAIIYKDKKTGVEYVFAVPAHFVGAKNIALVALHTFDFAGRPNIVYETIAKSAVIVRIKEEHGLHVVENFPVENGFYMTDPVFGIPVEKITGNLPPAIPEARYLLRSNGCYLGLVARGYDDPVEHMDTKFTIDIKRNPSDHLGLLGIDLGFLGRIEKIIAGIF
jgi:hypothetical protein